MKPDKVVTVRESQILGRIIGISSVSGGLCTFHCAYCTEVHTQPTTRRRRMVDPATLLPEVEAVWDAAAPVDYVVVGGAGDPLLWTGCGDFLRRLRARFGAPVAVLSPGPLFSRGTIRAAMANAALVVVKLDAGSADIMRGLNRPHRGVRFTRHVESLTAFARAFAGRFLVQCLVVHGMNDSEGDCVRLATAIESMAPSGLLLVRTRGTAIDLDNVPWRRLRGTTPIVLQTHPVGADCVAEGEPVSAGHGISCWQI